MPRSHLFLFLLILLTLGAAVAISCATEDSDSDDDASDNDGVDEYYMCDDSWKADCCVYDCDCQCDDGCDADPYRAIGKASDYNDLCACEQICEQRCEQKGCDGGTGQGNAFLNQFTRPANPFGF